MLVFGIHEIYLSCFGDALKRNGIVGEAVGSDIIMKKLFYIAACILLMGFLTQKENGDFAIGDFDGNGTSETAWIQSKFVGQMGDGEREVYMEANRVVLFSENTFPKIDISNASSLYNIGDVNGNQTDEILIAGYHGLGPFENTYAVYSFDSANRGWLRLLDASTPTNKQNDPSKWLYRSNDSIYYWSSMLSDDFMLIDTLRGIKK